MLSIVPFGRIDPLCSPFTARGWRAGSVTLMQGDSKILPAHPRRSIRSLRSDQRSRDSGSGGMIAARASPREIAPRDARRNSSCKASVMDRERVSPLPCLTLLRGSRFTCGTPYRNAFRLGFLCDVLGDPVSGKHDDGAGVQRQHVVIALERC